MATSHKQNGGPDQAKAAVLVQSAPIPDDAVPVVGPDLTKIRDIKSLMESYTRIGFQATSLARAIEIVQNMVAAKFPLMTSIDVPNRESGDYRMNLYSQERKMKVMEMNKHPERIRNARSSLGLLQT